MSKFRRRLTQGILVVLVATVGLGGWFFYFIRVAPESVLRRPESFSHRRMTVARLSGEQGYRFFFVTNRRPNTTLLRP